MSLDMFKHRTTLRWVLINQLNNKTQMLSIHAITTAKQTFKTKKTYRTKITILHIM